MRRICFQTCRSNPDRALSHYAMGTAGLTRHSAILLNFELPCRNENL
jgi:hypothetical protein